MSAERFEHLSPRAQDALWEIARTVIDMTPEDQYLAKVTTGQVVVHLAAKAHDDHIPGSFLIMAACKLAGVIESEATKESTND